MQRRTEQALIDAEVRASRQQLLATFRQRLTETPHTLVSEDFLSVTDRSVALTAIVIAAAAVADGCILHTVTLDPGTLRIARHRGVNHKIVTLFTIVDTATAGPYGDVLRTGEPVLIDDIATSPTVAGLPVLLDAGTRALHAYPLHADHGRLLGVLSLHHHAPGRHREQRHLAWPAARAMAQVTTNPGERVPTPAPTPAQQARPNRRESRMNADITATRTTDDVITLTVRGPLDVLTSPAFTAAAHQVIMTLDAGQVLIIDVNAVRSLAVAGVRALLAAVELCTTQGVHHYVLFDADHEARRVLDALDATRRLRLIPDAAEIVTGRRP
ncbi:GAF domain-containing protein [Actinoplanes sp. N902-109]|uniref:GAF domain-containing protein n=1 Tax=Actinoplanes sp. (strain N902-109) TaxID=649831 RepID=UPI0003295FE9|nr:GAF domain-containing protein [Actinoplanes sp. N902-109]AGL14827.1 multi-sensor signal transduction histidine kinase [Actinoplanes sp. N902-109]